MRRGGRAVAPGMGEWGVLFGAGEAVGLLDCNGGSAPPGTGSS